MDKIAVDGYRFIDSKNRHVILNGINLVYKGEKINNYINYIGHWEEEDFKNFSRWGFNIIRLGLIWDAIEPEPGKYNNEYLEWIESILDLCKKYHIYAFLDMHQDLYGVMFGDGAPQWATITDGQPHLEGELWSDGYIFSEAIKRAFDNFWANVPAPDGKGVQDHYIDMWGYVASRFANHPALLGYDFMNEPFSGSFSTKIFNVLMEECAQILNQVTGQKYTVENMISIFSNQKQKMAVLEILEDKKLYQTMIRAAESLVHDFDRGVLDLFYRRLSRTVRIIDTHGIIMRENSYFSNIGIMCKAQPIIYNNGAREPLQAYAPHGYDLVVDTDAVVYASNNRVDVIFDAHRRTQQCMNVPVIVGEWGGYGNYEKGLGHIEHLLSKFEDYLWSNTYWCYYKGFNNAPVLGVLKRPYPQAVCGELISYRYHRRAKIFTMKWNEDKGDYSTVIYMPVRDVVIEGVLNYEIQPMEDSAKIVIPPEGGQRCIVVYLG